MSDKILIPTQVIGIAIRTTNENNQAAQDIPALWNKFFTEDLINKIPNKINNTIYCIYTDYESDYTKPYTTILGCEVTSLVQMPENMVGKQFNEGNYFKQTAKGNLLEGLLFHEWVKIWNSDLPRAYTADFEVYDKRAANPSNAEVDILVAIK